MAKGLLLQKKGPMGVIMTQDGQFVRVFLRGRNLALGQEVRGTEVKFPSMLQGAVAAVVMLVMVAGLWMNVMANPAAAYVALDINPSLELTVNRSGKVINAVALDGEGQRLLKQVTTKDQELYEAVKQLVAGAAQLHYLNETNNVVLTTVTPLEDEVVVDEAKLQTAVQNTVVSLPLEVKIVTEQASTEEHQQATEKGISVGRYMIQQKSAQQGKMITLEEVKQKGLGQLEKEKGIQIELILPHAKYKVHMKETQKNDPKIDKEKAPQTNGNKYQFTPLGQLKKAQQQEQNKAQVDTKVIEPSKQKDQLKKNQVQNRGKVEEGQNKAEQEIDRADDENEASDKRRTDRRPSQLSTEKEKDKEHSTQKSEIQDHIEKSKKDKD